MIVYYYRTSKGEVVSNKSDAMLIYVSMNNPFSKINPNDIWLLTFCGKAVSELKNTFVNFFILRYDFELNKFKLDLYWFGNYKY
jgi:hypothetical protein